MSAISQTRLYELLVPKLGKEATEGLITFNESKIKSEVENTCKHLATKEDVLMLKEDLAKMNGKLEGKIGESIKWMFVFWVTQLIATFSFLAIFLKK